MSINEFSRLSSQGGLTLAFRQGAGEGKVNGLKGVFYSFGLLA